MFLFGLCWPAAERARCSRTPMNRGYTKTVHAHMYMHTHTLGSCGGALGASACVRVHALRPCTQFNYRMAAVRLFLSSGRMVSLGVAEGCWYAEGRMRQRVLVTFAERISSDRCRSVLRSVRRSIRVCDDLKCASLRVDLLLCVCVCASVRCDCAGGTR